MPTPTSSTDSTDPTPTSERSTDSTPTSSPGTTMVWFRRDLRLGDHPALTAAAEAAGAGGTVLGLFVLDPSLRAVGQVRMQRLLASLAALREETGGALVIRTGDPQEVVAQVAAEVGARQVHISAETTPFGRRRDDRVGRALAEAGVELVATGSPYAVTPGRVLTGSGTGYQVFTPFSKAWRAHGWREPLPVPDLQWHQGVASDPLPVPPRDESADDDTGPSEPAGERAAIARWEEFLSQDLPGYAEDRDRPDLDSTSRMSVPLKYGEVHPRTLLADLAQRAGGGDDPDVERFVTELAWRDFYADVLWHSPESAWHDWRDTLAGLEYDHDAHLLGAWCSGRTGFPFVDAGMRQLLAEGWMHNRVRMVTASFLVKDLHLWWPAGARHFLRHLRDGDVASNNHGWQWTAGTGTDASPYFRIFNPVTQGKRFDPQGDYVRRWIPELRHLSGAAAHEPWKHQDGYQHGYPEPVVEHDVERQVSLARYAAAKEAAELSRAAARG